MRDGLGCGAVEGEAGTSGTGDGLEKMETSWLEQGQNEKEDDRLFWGGM